jgi:leucyl aminopeptidase
MASPQQNRSSEVFMSFKLALDIVALKEIGRPARGRKAAGARTLVVFAGADLDMGRAATQALGGGLETVRRAAEAARFKGKASSAIDLWAPANVDADRLLVIGCAAKAEGEPRDYVALGGYVMGKLGAKGAADIVFDPPGESGSMSDAAADFALGLRLRAYRFDRYKTKKADDADQTDGAMSVRVGVADPTDARRAARAREALAQGVTIARDLVNEPPNVLYPEEFARRARELEKLGVVVEILDEKAMRKLGMNALLGVGQGSIHESRMVVMRWNGAKGVKGAKARPIAFIGKGVTFDTGGISIKPAGGMEDMKGDMAGAACVVGLMHALAARKAQVNVIGAIGLVENMPDGKAQRPGDIVKTMSGQTVEIINTDAEGRLVLADVLWRVQSAYDPQFMINLATLTGAILVALGTEHAGLFSNDDQLSERIAAAGKATGEKVWRMPLGPAYDKLLESKFADMKNVGGRHAGSITAAQFLQRFVNKKPWAHLDIAGTGMSSPANDINQSWGSGWGVRLLDRLVADHYEK